MDAEEALRFYVGVTVLYIEGGVVQLIQHQVLPLCVVVEHLEDRVAQEHSAIENKLTLHSPMLQEALVMQQLQEHLPLPYLRQII